MGFFANYSENVLSKVDWGQAVLIFVLGIATVFAVLMILWGVLTLMKVAFNKSNDSVNASVKSEPTAAPQKTAVNERKMSTPKAVATSAPNNEDELLAIFTSTIATYGNSTNLRVKSYKKL